MGGTESATGRRPAGRGRHSACPGFAPEALYAFVIRALLQRVDRPVALRAIGLVLVVALVVLAMFAGLHASDADHAGHPCTVCDAAFAAAGAALPTPSIVSAVAAPLARAEHRAPQRPAAFDADVAHAPRGPPARS